MTEQEERTITINEELLSDFIPKKTTDEGKYKYGYTIPRFQRDFVWEYKDLIDLWDSIYRNYPIGSFLIWESEESLPDNREIAQNIYLDKLGGTTYKYILDGQQRITSIIVSYLNGIKNHPNKKNPMDLTIYFSLKNAKQEEKELNFEEKKKIKLFFSKKDRKELSPEEQGYLIEVKNLVKFNPDIYAQFFDKERDIAEIYHKVTNRIGKYKLSIITLKNIPREEVSELFTRVNTRGQKLSTIDLLTAYTYSSDFYLKDENLYLEALFGNSNIEGKLEKTKYNDIDELSFIRLISLIRKGECKESDLFEIKADDFKAYWEIASDSLFEAINFLKKMNITSSIILPYEPIIISLAYFQYILRINKVGLSEDIRKDITKWFWVKSFNGDYQGATNEEIKKDCEAFKRHIENKEEFNYNTSKKDYSSDEIISTKLNLSSGFCKTILCLMANTFPKDFTNHNDVDIYNDVLIKYKKNEYHHIFPKKSNSVVGVPDDKKNSIVNICFLPKQSNESISNSDPSIYFVDKVKNKNAHYKEDLNSNLIPFDDLSGIWDNNFDNFLKDRAEIIYNKIQEVTGNLTTIEKDMQLNENKPIDEFEETIRKLIDYKLREIDSNYWENKLPKEFVEKIEERITLELQKHPNEQRELINPLEFCQILDYFKIIKNNWEIFEPIFKSRTELEKHFLNINELRNAIKHTRQINLSTKKLAEGSLLWFEQILKEEKILIENCALENNNEEMHFAKEISSEHTIEEHLNGKSEQIKELYSELRKRICDLGDNITEVPHKFYIAYVAHHNFLAIFIKSDRIILESRIKFSDILDPKQKLLHPSEHGIAKGGIKLYLADSSDLEYVMDIIKQCYESKL